MNYSKRLIDVTPDRLQRALDRFGLGTLRDVAFVPTGHFGQNLYLSTSSGEYVFPGNPYRPDQFVRECFFARLITEQTSLHTPWPCHHDRANDIFGWPYAIMPRLSGWVSTDPARPPREIEDAAWTHIAFAQGEAVARLQQPRFDHPATFDSGSESLQPMRGGYLLWARGLVERLRADAPDLSSADQDWIDARIADMPTILAAAFRPSLCHADIHNANLLVERQAGRWLVTGIIDLTSCHIGHPESDLARQFCMYAAWNPALAHSFLDGYASKALLNPGWQHRLHFFAMHDRLKYWTFGKRRGNAWWDLGWSFCDYLAWHTRHIP